MRGFIRSATADPEGEKLSTTADDGGTGERVLRGARTLRAPGQHHMTCSLVYLSLSIFQNLFVVPKNYIYKFLFTIMNRIIPCKGLNVSVVIGSACNARAKPRKMMFYQILHQSHKFYPNSV